MIKVERTKDDNFVIGTDDWSEVVDFIGLTELKERIDQMHSDEQSRILMESLTGDYVCDGCTI